MSAAPFGSVYKNAKVWDDPLPELGVTDTAAGGPLLTAAVMVSPALVLLLNEPLVPVTVAV
jgi:hypothetical protein